MLFPSRGHALAVLLALLVLGSAVVITALRSNDQQQAEAKRWHCPDGHIMIRSGLQQLSSAPACIAGQPAEYR